MPRLEFNKYTVKMNTVRVYGSCHEQNTASAVTTTGDWFCKCDQVKSLKKKRIVRCNKDSIYQTKLFKYGNCQSLDNKHKSNFSQSD